MGKINKKLLPIKSHYFFFMAAMGPILPQMPVYGKQLGISSVVMGSVTAILPFTFLLAKPVFGLLVDIYRDYRKCIFASVIAAMSLSFAMLCLLPVQTHHTVDYMLANVSTTVDSCNVTRFNINYSNTLKYLCTCKNDSSQLNLYKDVQSNNTCMDFHNKTIDGAACTTMNCLENMEMASLYKTWTFWYFILFMSIGMIGFNVSNSISDAVCFDVIGDEYDFGKQRVWGTIGFGLSALLSGYFVNWVSEGATSSYVPAFLIMLIFTALDLFSCVKLELPIMQRPENIFKDIGSLISKKHTIIFLIYAVFAGILDSFIIYFLFWYLEDLAEEVGTKDIKLIEGLVVAAETLGGEVLFFSIAGKILDRIGHAHCFSICFLNYALRLGLISVIPSPWWALPIEFMLQGPTYALTYTCIVAYANAIAPPGASATMQGIAAGMDDGFGYAIGSFLGGFLYKSMGGRFALQIFCCIGLLCSVTHLGFSKFMLNNNLSMEGENRNGVEYRTPQEAVRITYESCDTKFNCI